MFVMSGGEPMEPNSGELQYMIREHLVEEGMDHLKEESHGMVSEGSRVRIRWNSQVRGRVCRHVALSVI